MAFVNTYISIYVNNNDNFYFYLAAPDILAPDPGSSLERIIIQN